MSEGLQGLKGLKGLSSLSPEEIKGFMEANKDKLSKYNTGTQLSKAANVLYMNQKFINTFGKDEFDKLNNGTAEAFHLRNKVLKDKIATDEIVKLTPFDKNGVRDNHRGLGENWEKAMELSTDGKIKLLESDYQNPDKLRETIDNSDYVGKLDNYMRSLGNKYIAPYIATRWQDLSTNLEGVRIGTNAIKGHLLEKNEKLFNDIYSKDSKEKADQLVSDVYKKYESLSGWSDDKVLSTFTKMITPGSYTNENGVPNLGISEYASYYGNGKDISSEMKDFSIDDMRWVIAKKMSYDQNMSPTQASTVQNDEAKKYISDHQGTLKAIALGTKDLAIRALSYTSDKVNGITDIKRQAEDLIFGTPTVYTDAMTGEIIPSRKVTLNKDGSLTYIGKDGKAHYVNKEKMSRSALHYMGKEEDGSDIEGAFGTDFLTTNPLYWSRAEQFGTFDESLQKQYEKLGSSPYQIAWDPDGGDSHIWYETAMMTSFGIADKGMELLPFGIGKAGKVMSTLSKSSKLMKGLGKTLETTGKFLSQESKAGQVLQGAVGALGISYAYSRGTYQELLAKNLAALEEATQNKVRKELADRYDNDKQFKSNIETQISSLVPYKKAEILRELKRQQAEGNKVIYDEAQIDKQAYSKASEEIYDKVIRMELQSEKLSPEYTKAHEEAIAGASNAALMTYWPEALKYGYVNTLGWRKFMYKTPGGAVQKLDKGLKDVREVVKDDKKRLELAKSKFKTTNDKLKQFGKTAISQFWGGAWTNGTDDMMVDAARQVNDDSYRKYLDAYQNGDASAAVYGVLDGLYSYWNGFGESLGKGETINATIVGGLGGTMNFLPQFSNITKLFTKKGREAYKNNFWSEAEKDDKGNVVKNADGTIKYKRLGRFHNLGEQANYLLSNGVLNTFYANMQSEDALKDHINYVNGLLDHYDDFKDIEKLMAANMVTEETTGTGNKKTISFIDALLAMRTLNNLANNSDDPAKMSSVIQNAKKIIAQAKQLDGIDIDAGENPLDEEATKNLLAEYYAYNPSIAQNEYENRQALKTIGYNARKLSEGSEALEEAEKEVSKIEKSRGESIDQKVKDILIMNKALNVHWRARRQKMRDELGDVSSETDTMDEQTLMATLGGVDNAKALVTVYERQYKELEEDLENQKKETEKLNSIYSEALKALKDAQNTKNSDKIFNANKAYKEALANLNSSKHQEKMIESMMTSTLGKKTSLEESINALAIDVDSGKRNVKVLTADEIFALDPITRAKMLDERNKEMYSKEQLAEIEKLRKDLVMKDSDALNKIQDIALLTYRINANKDAYEKIAEDPEAAATAVENQIIEAAKDSYNMVNQRQSEILVKGINDVMSDPSISKLSKEDKENIVFSELRKYNSDMLDIIEKDEMLPEYIPQVAMAKEYSKTAEEIISVISKMEGKSDEQKKLLFNSLAQVIQPATNREEIIKILEAVVNSVEDKTAREDVRHILEGLKRIETQKESTITEKPEDRKARETKEKTARDEKKKRDVEQAEAAGQKAANQRGNNGSKKGKTLAYKRKENRKNKSNQNDFSKVDPENSTLNSTEDVDLGETEENNSGNSGDNNRSNDNSTNKEAEKVTAERNGNSITFVQNGEYVEILLDPSEFEYDGSGTRMYEGVPFVAYAIVDHGDVMLISGSFADSGVQGSVQTSKNFNLNKILAEQKQRREKLKEKLKEKFKEKNGPKTTEPKTEGNNKEQTSKVNSLLKEEVKDGTVDAGEIWYGSEGHMKKMKFTIEKKGNEITFKADGNEVYLNLEPSDYTIPSDDEHKGTDSPFEAYSLENNDGNWEFVGSFADEDNITRLPMKKGFDLEKAIERVKEAAESQALSEGMNVESPSLVVTDEGVGGRVPTIEEQAKEAEKEGGEVVVAESTDTTDINDTSDGKITLEEDRLSASNVLTGTGMREYDTSPDSKLVKDGVLERRKPRPRRNDALASYFNWMDAEGIKLQNIIDRELSMILKANPHAKVKFMAVRVADNATHDVDMQKHLLLVLDYDDKVNPDITSIHDNSNGGVLESQGKKYLVIGVAGYIAKDGVPRNVGQRDLFNSMWNLTGEGNLNIKIARKDFFAKHQEERFFVDDRYSTEVVPYSLVPGYRVRQTEKDSKPFNGSVIDLLEGENGERNPLGIKLEDAVWGIQEGTEFVLIKGNTNAHKEAVSPGDVMIPRDKEGNRGRAFILVPAGNGKYFPGYFKPLMYNEMKKGALKNEIDALLTTIAGEDSEAAHKAIKELFNYFYISTEGDNILRNDKYRTLTLKHEGKTFKSFTLNDSFKVEDFLKAVAEMKPRINITVRKLQDPSLIRKYAEAGAMQIDLTLFHTAGSTYTIYGLDSKGNMMVTTNPSNSNNPRELERPASQIVYDHKFYREADGEFSIDGEAVTDENTLRQLRTLKRILDNQLVPAKKTKTESFYILSSGEHPEVVKVNNNSQKVETLSEEAAKQFIEQIAKEKLDEQREKAAERELSNLQDVDLGEDGAALTSGTGTIINQETGFEEGGEPLTDNTLTPEGKEDSKNTEKKQEEKRKMEQEEKKAQKAAKLADLPDVKPATQTFEKMFINKSRKKKILAIVRKKWENAPVTAKELSEFLREKGVEVDAIGTSEEDIQRWLDTLENCR